MATRPKIKGKPFSTRLDPKDETRFRAALKRYNIQNPTMLPSKGQFVRHLILLGLAAMENGHTIESLEGRDTDDLDGEDS